MNQTFQLIDRKYDFFLRSFSNGKNQEQFNCDWSKNEDWKSGYTTMQKKMQLFVPYA